jgi:biopolymer transport protein ExbD
MVSGVRNDRGQPAMAEINIIPLCDVLLVLLIIFMVTAPALSQQIDLDLPQAAPPTTQPPASISLRIAASGEVFWNGEQTGDPALALRMRDTVRQDPGNQPMLQIDANGDADYQAVVRVLAAAENAGMSRIGFVRQ